MSSRTRSTTPKKAPTHSKKQGAGRKLFNTLGMLAVIAFVGFCLVVLFSTPRQQADSGPKLPQRTGTAWEYDERFDAYWDPREGHEHWHTGRPPADQDP